MLNISLKNYVLICFIYILKYTWNLYLSCLGIIPSLWFVFLHRFKHSHHHHLYEDLQKGSAPRDFLLMPFAQTVLFSYREKALL